MKKPKVNKPGDVIQHKLLGEGEWVVMDIIDLRGQDYQMGGMLHECLEHNLLCCRKLKEGKIDWLPESRKDILLRFTTYIKPLRRMDSQRKI